MNRFRPRRVVPALLVTAAMVIPASAAQAGAGIDVRAGGPCTAGDVTWSIKATPTDGQIKVTFKIDAGVPDQNWHVLVEHNHMNLFKGHKFTADNGIVVIKKKTEDSSGDDVYHLEASTPGVYCEGKITVEE